MPRRMNRSNPYLKLTEVGSVLVSLQYFMVFNSVVVVQDMYNKSLKDVCYIDSRPLSSAILNFLRI